MQRRLGRIADAETIGDKDRPRKQGVHSTVLSAPLLELVLLRKRQIRHWTGREGHYIRLRSHENVRLGYRGLPAQQLLSRATHRRRMFCAVSVGRFSCLHVPVLGCERVLEMRTAGPCLDLERQ